ncbi:MAG: signal recognition particle-docking protein FtsY [Alphaproteobacteria bacterium]|nr:signal recognition particle-docking protein FtsY [Alphaproteobacteria bacterium]
MAGFFKKLFNRIAGKAEEAVVETPVLTAAVEDSAPVIVAEETVEVPKPVKVKAPSAAKSKKLPTGKVKPVSTKAAKPEPGSERKAKAAKTEPALAPQVKTKVVAPATRTMAAPPAPKPKQKMAAKPVPVEVPPPKPVEIVPSPPPSLVAPPSQVVVAPAPAISGQAEFSAGGWLSRLRSGLSKSSKSITGSITAIFTKRKLDRETLQELEDTLIQADLGLAVSERIIAAVSHGRYDKEIDPEEVKQILATEVAKVLKPVEVPFNFGSEKPFVVMVVGVNGAGKTTTIGKLGSIAAAEGFKVMFAACDTFRAAAIEQLTVWGNRIGATTISRPTGADSAGLAFDALKQAREDGTDILFIDTAGRLQNKAYLMDELDKVVRVIKKQDEAAPHAVLLVLDATTGQNALAQAEIFTKVAGVTGLIMTKLDGTARGGILVAIAEKFKLPIHAIGVGETIDDLQPFDAQAFSRAIAGFEN